MRHEFRKILFALFIVAILAMITDKCSAQQSFTSATALVDCNPVNQGGLYLYEMSAPGYNIVGVMYDSIVGGFHIPVPLAASLWTIVSANSSMNIPADVFNIEANIGWFPGNEFKPVQYFQVGTALTFYTTTVRTGCIYIYVSR